MSKDLNNNKDSVQTTVEYNTITGWQVGINSQSANLIRYNNIYNNGINLKNDVNWKQVEMNAGNNWWGTLDASLIAAKIIDYDDDINKGKVNYSPLLTQVYDGTLASLPQGPANPQVVINGGVSLTTSRDVVLSLSADETPVEARISEDSSFTGINYQTYAPSVNYQLSEGLGAKRIYVQFKDASGNESAVAVATIDYKPPDLLDGLIAQNQTLTVAVSPYTVTADLEIQAGVVLTIEPGVIVKIGS